jgi:Right handed beta helix region/Inverse autotransporter, beta-domain
MDANTMVPFGRRDDGGWIASRGGSAIRLLVLLIVGVALCLGTGLPRGRTLRGDSDSSNNTDDEDSVKKADDDAADQDQNDDERPKKKSYRTTTSERDPRGVFGRVGHIAFPTFGRSESISNVELVPYMISGDSMVFGDARLFLDNQARFGSNGGLGFREWAPNLERLFGASLWYDFDQTSGKPFHQGGVSVETLGRWWDFRGNGYIPFGDHEKDYVNSLSNIHFQENQIVFDHLRSFAEAQAGFDLEFGLAVPSDFAANHNLRAFAGYYHFLGRDVPDINGFRGRLEGNLTDHIALQVQVTDDKTFGTNVSLGVAISLGKPSYRSSEVNQKLWQMSRYIERNYNVIATKRDVSEYGIPAINPANGQPYLIEHVAASDVALAPLPLNGPAAGSGSGTVNDPFTSIAAAQAAGGDVVFVHSGSVIGTPVVLNPGQRVLGEGVQHLINTQRFGYIALPSATGGTTLPVLQGIPGDAVTLAAGAEFSGFTIDGPTGHGIVGTGVAGATVRNVTIQNAGGDGILLTNSTGNFVFENVGVNNAAGAALHVDGGTPDVLLNGWINNSAGRAVVIENTTGGTVHLENTDVVDNGGSGILVSNNGGNVVFGNADVRNSTATGIDVQGGTGTTQFTKLATVINSAGPGINVENAAGPTTFNDVSVTNATGAQGVRIVNSPGTTSIANLNVSIDGATGLFMQNNGTVAIAGGTIAATNASAVDIENTTMNVVLTSVSSAGGVNGIRIVGSPGSFVIQGNGGDGSGGLIQGANVGVLVENSGTVALQSMHLDGNATGLSAFNTDYLVFHGGQVVNSAGHGIELLNVRRFELIGSTLTNNGGNSLHAQVDVPGSYSYLIQSNTIDNANNSPIVIATLPSGNDSTLSLNVNSNDISMSAIGSRAVQLDWNGALVSTMTGNVIVGSGDSSRGIDVNAGSTTQLAQITVNQNAFTFGGSNSTAIHLTTSGQSDVTIGGNSVVFNAADGIGADFTVAQASNIDVFSNVITDNVSRGTGLLFSSINGTSRVTIDNNTIQLLSPDAFVDRGIIFSTVTGTVELSGSRNNSVSGATTPFSAIGTTGQIIVNGFLVP